MQGHCSQTSLYLVWAVQSCAPLPVCYFGWIESLIPVLLPGCHLARAGQVAARAAEGVPRSLARHCMVFASQGLTLPSWGPDDVRLCVNCTQTCCTMEQQGALAFSQFVTHGQCT